MLKGIENVLNNCHLTVVYYTEVRQTLTPNELLSRRNFNTEVFDINNKEPTQNISKRFAYTKKLLENFKIDGITNIWNCYVDTIITEKRSTLYTPMLLRN